MEPTVCITNIGPRLRRQRLLFGLVMAAAAALFLLAVQFLALPRAVRLLVFFPAWMAGLGIFQFLEKT